MLNLVNSVRKKKVELIGEHICGNLPTHIASFCIDDGTREVNEKSLNLFLPLEYCVVLKIFVMENPEVVSAIRTLIRSCGLGVIFIWFPFLNFYP